MKKTIAILLFCCSFFQGFTQDYSTKDKKAIQLFEKAMMSYRQRQIGQAEEQLKLAIARDSNFLEATIELALFYAEKSDFDQSIFYLSRAASIDATKYPMVYYYLGKFELKKGNYEKTKGHLLKYKSLEFKDLKKLADSDRMLKQCDFALNNAHQKVAFNPINMGPEINSPDPEYYPCLTADDETLLFTRQISSSKTMTGTNEDFYVAFKNKGKWTSSRNLGPPINSLNNEGAPTLSVDGNLLIFTACPLYGDYGPGRKGFGSCDLFFSQRMGNEWSAPRNIGPPVSTKYWETQPSFASDGRTLYFVRGKNTGTGIQDQDIYRSYLTDSGWTDPVRLDSNINTSGREESVMIHPDGNTLYFSSDGHPGYGGLDIFVSRKDSSGNWTTPQNMGFPINSQNDENSLMVDAQGNVGYFASNRSGGYGSLDLYRFDLPADKKPGKVTFMKGRVFDALTKKPLLAKFDLIDLKTGETIIESYSNGGNGEFLVCLPPDRDYALNSSKDGYLFYSDNFRLTKNENSEKPYYKDVPLYPIAENAKVVLNNIFFETGKYNLKKESKVELGKLVLFLNKNAKVKIEIGGHTDNTGTKSINITLSENRAKAVYTYLIEHGIEAARLSFKGYADDQPIADNASPKGRAKNRRTEFKITAVQ